MRTLVLSAMLASTGCSTVLVSHVRGNDYDTPGVRYWLPAPYLLVRSAVEIGRTETLYSMSPIDKTVLRRVVPCDDNQAACKPRAATPPPPPIASAPTGAQSSRPGVSATGTAQSELEDSVAVSREAAIAVGEADRLVAEAGEREGAPATTVVWLPDYCQQYAIAEKDHTGSQKVQIQLADGWKLTALNTEINNTEVLQKMFDMISSLAGTMTASTQKLANTGIQTATNALQRGTQGAQAGRTRLFRRTRVTTFKPGLYSMLQYPLTKDNEPDCAKLPSFRPPKDATVQSEFWSEVASTQDAAATVVAAPVDPGRPASVIKPPVH